ncbi:6,7-dimethyl-8-ribityllumazine synthase [Candidatus Micrarchaeota archaeon]|nr:6,7-dimethyl-8-ribityllumazine synthase [Candidatus Micrarchaeota archaeon]
MEKIRLGIVVSEFNTEITEKMLKTALKRAKSLQADVNYIFKVPGAFDSPIAIQNLLRKKNVDAVVTLGAVIKGETKHDELITSAITRRITDLALTYNKPVTLGISGPGITYEQAKARIDGYSARAVEAAVTLVKRLRKLSNDESILIE